METLFKWVLDNIIALLSIILTPFLAYIFSRRTQIANAKKVDADSTGVLITSSGQLVTSWQEYAKEMKKEFNEANQRNNEILTANRTLISQNDTLIGQNAELKLQNTRLSEQIQTLEIKFNQYTAGIEKIFTLMLAEIETTNPDLASRVRDNFSQLSRIISN